jgi:hypothetical protein
MFHTNRFLPVGNPTEILFIFYCDETSNTGFNDIMIMNSEATHVCPWEFLVTWQCLQDVFSTNHCNATARSCALLAFGFDVEMSLSDFLVYASERRLSRCVPPHVLRRPTSFRWAMAYKHTAKSNNLRPNLFAKRFQPAEG